MVCIRFMKMLSFSVQCKEMGQRESSTLKKAIKLKYLSNKEIENKKLLYMIQIIFTVDLLLDCCCCFLSCFILRAVPFIEVMICFFFSSFLKRFSSSSSIGSPAPSLTLSPSSPRSVCCRTKSS